MAPPINIYDAKAHFSELIERARRGEEIIIAKAGTPVARLVPLVKPTVKRKPGSWRGKVWIARDFDAPLPSNIQRAFEDSDD